MFLIFLLLFEFTLCDDISLTQQQNTYLFIYITIGVVGGIILVLTILGIVAVVITTVYLIRKYTMRGSSQDTQSSSNVEIEGKEGELKQDEICVSCLYGGQGSRIQKLSLSIREPFKKKFEDISPVEMKIGKFYYDGSKRIQLIDLDYKFCHKDIVVENDTDRNFSDMFFNLRSGRYTPYSHCKYCFIEQHEHHAKYNTNVCCKCGLPCVHYINFDEEERFCVVCSLMNKYHPRPHIRCLLHPSGKGKKLGAMYVLYKEYFSISSASKPKKRTKKSEKLKTLLLDEVWKLNSAIRLEFLWAIRRIVRKSLTGKHLNQESINDMHLTRNEILKRLNELGPNMTTTYAEHGLEINLKGDEFSGEMKAQFFLNLKNLFKETVIAIDNHLEFLKKMKDAGKNQKIEVGTKRQKKDNQGMRKTESFINDERSSSLSNRKEQPTKRRKMNPENQYLPINFNLNINIGGETKNLHTLFRDFIGRKKSKIVPLPKKISKDEQMQIMYNMQKIKESQKLQEYDLNNALTDVNYDTASPGGISSNETDSPGFVDDDCEVKTSSASLPSWLMSSRGTLTSGFSSTSIKTPVMSHESFVGKTEDIDLIMERTRHLQEKIGAENKRVGYFDVDEYIASYTDDGGSIGTCYGVSGMTRNIERTLSFERDLNDDLPSPQFIGNNNFNVNLNM